VGSENLQHNKMSGRCLMDPSGSSLPPAVSHGAVSLFTFQLLRCLAVANGRLELRVRGPLAQVVRAHG
jgi:hypothetical protein